MKRFLRIWTITTSVTRSSVSQTELARLTRSINLKLKIEEDGSRRGIRVEWARRGRSGMVLWDEVGHWRGMPERIEEAVYGGLTTEEQVQIEQQTPRVFRSSEIAIAWGMDQGVFETIEAARRTYEQVKQEGQPNNAHEMAAFWVDAINNRKAAASAGPEAAGGAEPVEPPDFDRAPEGARAK